MSKQINIGGRLHSTEQGNVITGANEVLDDTKGKKQNVINADVDAELLRLDQSKQNNLTFDNTPTENSTNPVTSGGVYAANITLHELIEAILVLIPSAASALNQLADKAFVNSSVSTATATFRGTYNVVTDLELAYDASHEQIATKLGQVIATADNNDYAFVQVPVSATSTDIRRTERYKFNGTVWGYEYDLNTSGFTAVQWEAINSGITALLVSKLTNLPTAEVLATMFDAKQNVLTFDAAPTALSTNPVYSGGVYAAIKAITDLIPAEATTTNQLADKAYVLAQILAATPAFKGQFETLVELQAVQSPKAGDMGIVRTKNSDGYDVFTFYQYFNNQWNVFYTLSHHLLNKPATTGTTGAYPYNGMGRVVIPKKMVNGVNTLTHEAFEDSEGNDRENTIYIIRYDFTLGEDITVPDNCVLEFDGGSISGAYIITGDNTGINAELVKIFNTNVTLSGTWNVAEAYPEWFGCIKNNDSVDSADSLEKCLRSPFRNVFLSGIYYISKPVAITYNVYISSGGLGGITAKNDFLPITRTTKQGITREVNSLLCVTNDYFDLSLFNVSLNGNYKASTSVDWLGYINGVKYYKCHFRRFYEAGVIVAFSDSSTIENCIFHYNYIGVQISSNEVDYSKPFKNTASNPHIYSPNHVSVVDCNLMFNVIGMFLFNSSDITLNNNLFGQDSLCSIYAHQISVMSIDNLYIEDDFTMEFVIEKNQTNDPQIDTTPSSELIEQLNSINELGARAFVIFSQCAACINRQTLSYVGSHIRTTKGSDVDTNMRNDELIGIDSAYYCSGSENVLRLGIIHRTLQNTNKEPAYDVVVSKVYTSVDCKIISDMPISVKDVTAMFTAGYGNPLVSINESNVIPIIINQDPHLDNFESAVNSEYYSNGTIGSINFFAFTKYAETINGIKLFKNTYSSPTLVNSISVDLTKLTTTTYFIRYFYKVVGSEMLSGLSLEITIKYSDDTYRTIQTQPGNVYAGNAGKFGHVDFWFTKSDFNYYDVENAVTKEAVKIFVSVAAYGTEHYISPLMCGECGINSTVVSILKDSINTLPDLTGVNNSNKVSILYALSGNYPRYIYWNVDKWTDYDGAKVDVPRSGTFAQKPSSSDIYIGFRYFCTDKQSPEQAAIDPSVYGIEIIHKGNNVWVDALGRNVS